VDLIELIVGQDVLVRKGRAEATCARINVGIGAPSQRLIVLERIKRQATDVGLRLHQAILPQTLIRIRAIQFIVLSQREAQGKALGWKEFMN